MMDTITRSSIYTKFGVLLIISLLFESSFNGLLRYLDLGFASGHLITPFIITLTLLAWVQLFSPVTKSQRIETFTPEIIEAETYYLDDVPEIIHNEIITKSESTIISISKSRVKVIK